MNSNENFNAYSYARTRSNSPNNEPNVLDLSYLDLEDCESNLKQYQNERHEITCLLLNNNILKSLPSIVCTFSQVQTLDLSCNQLKTLSLDIIKMKNLRNLICKDNLLGDSSLPKDLCNAVQLESIHLSGNVFTQFPFQLLEIKSLREIYLGSNKIQFLPRNYENLQRLEVLYLGGNRIKSIPEELSQLKNLTSLNLSNNNITSLPCQLAKLKKIRNLALHANNLTTLPIELVMLMNLNELSLRNNPLVNNFAKEYTYQVPSLLELSGRIIKSKNVSYNIEANRLPKHLVQYLNSAQCCLNPKCKGVYFTSKIEHVKFVDFCGILFNFFSHKNVRFFSINFFK